MKSASRRIAAFALAFFAAAALYIHAGAAYDYAQTAATSGKSSYAVMSDGALYAWGDNAYGQLGTGNRTNQLKPVKLALGNVVSVTAGADFALALKSDGELYAWGNNTYGQLGTGQRATVMSPVKVADGIASVSAGYDHTLAVGTDGMLYAWGANTYGQLGDGSRKVSLTPKAVGAGYKFAAAGKEYSLAITADGTLYAWGNGEHARLGDGQTITRINPVKIASDAVYAAAAESHSAYIAANGDLYTWGSNVNGQLGDGRTVPHRTPVKVASGVVSVSLAAAYAEASDDASEASDDASEAYAEYAALLRQSGSTFYVTADGTVYASGRNDCGQLGNGKRGADALKPAAVKTISGGTFVAASNSSAFAVTKTGDLYACGDNSVGQLGTGDRRVRLEPVKITGGAAVPGKPAEAAVSRDKVSLNGAAVAFDAYTIEGYNYFKLRDLASALTVTNKRFEVEFDFEKQSVYLTSGKPYTPEGGELAAGGGAPKSVKTATHSVYLDDVKLDIAGYLIDGNNYFKLRDLMSAIDVYVGYDSAARTITLDTSRGYVPE
ncbi:MAG: hypothetical protein LBS90_03675 [Oscillospiraceae bacterium]|jgi:alpha-tubulin suppressor-like RCC1 family protein|nr:hypothetical protein [Oscillospiraceae bacterium]